MDEMEPRSSGAPRAMNFSALSEREREVLDLALVGLSARAIAERLSLTEATVRSHLSRIYAKLDVGGRVELLAQINGSDVAGDASSASAGLDAEPRRSGRQLPRSVLVLVLLVVGVSVAFAWLRPDLPPSTDLATVSRLVADHQVVSLDLRGDTLFVATLDGRQFRVDGPDPTAVQTLQVAAIAGSNRVSVSAGGDTLATSLAMLATAVAPLVLLALLAVLVLRLLGRPPEARLTG